MPMDRAGVPMAEHQCLLHVGDMGGIALHEIYSDGHPGWRLARAMASPPEVPRQSLHPVDSPVGLR
jgi:hypothetical protein